MSPFKLCSIFLFIHAFHCGAQRIDNTPFFKDYQSHHSVFHWTTSNGLPQSHIAAITQTRNKLVYIATNNGVTVTDGRRFNRITVDSLGLNQQVTAIHHVGDSVLWSSTKEFVIYYDRKLIKRVALPQQFIVKEIREVAGKFYLLGPDGILRVDHKKTYPLFICDRQLITKGQKFIDFTVTNQTIYALVHGQKKWIFGFNLRDAHESQILPKKSISHLSSHAGKLIVFDGSSWSHVDENGAFRPFIKFRKPLSGVLVTDVFESLTFEYNGSELLIKHLNEEFKLDVQPFMHGNAITTSFVDGVGNLWLGTNSYGIFLFRRYPFEYVFPQQQTTISNSSSAFVDDDGICWIDNNCQEIIASDPTTHKILTRIPNICSQAAVQWSADTIAFFGNTRVHYWYNRKTKKTGINSSVKFPVNSCYRKDSKTVLLSSPGTLYEWNGRTTRKIVSFANPSTVVNEFSRLADGTILLATSEGVYQLKQQKWKLILGEKQLKTIDCRSFQLLEKHNVLLVGTAGSGIVKYDLNSGKVTGLNTVPPQLLFCWSILEDRFGQLWVASNNGIVQVEVADLLKSFRTGKNYLQLNRFQYESGIDNAEFNSRTQNKSTVLRDGSLLFSGLGGPILIRPVDNHRFNNLLAQIIIERVIRNGRDESAVTNTLDITEGDVVQLSFTLPAFAQERILNFEYRIKGSHTDWITLNSRQLVIDNLPAGTYILEIRTLSQARKLTIPLEVRAASEYLWLWYLLAILFGMIFIVWMALLIARIIRNRRQKQILDAQRLKVLEAEALRSQMNPHFIFNCLNTIQFLFMAGNVEKANKYLSDFSALMRITLDLLRQSVTTLETELKATNLYVELEKLQFDDGFEYRMINRLKTPETVVQTPSLFLQIFVENAIIHGLRDLSVKNPILTLILEEDESRYYFRVCDNGPGFGKSHSAETHNSVGTNLALERFKLKNEIYNWNITYSTKEYPDCADDIHTEVCISFSKNPHITVDNA